MSEAHSHLYILIFPKLKAFKVGKADKVLGRIKKLQTQWGEPAYAESYYLEAPIKTVFDLEKGLHGSLGHVALEGMQGDGATELFKMEALESCLGLLENMLQLRGGKIELRKGIEKPKLCSPLKKNQKRKWMRYSMDNCLFGNLHQKHQTALRYLIILDRYRHQFKLTSDFDEKEQTHHLIFDYSGSQSFNALYWGEKLFALADLGGSISGSHGGTRFSSVSISEDEKRLTLKLVKPDGEDTRGEIERAYIRMLVDYFKRA